MDFDSVLPLLQRIYASANMGIDDNGQTFHRIPDTVTAQERQQLADAGWEPNDQVQLPHDAATQRLRSLAAQVDLRRAADAFVSSLGSGGLHWQAVLPSVALGLAMPEHAMQPMGQQGDRCATCFHTTSAKDRTLLAYFRSIEGSGWSDEDGPLGAVLALEDAVKLPQELWPRPTPRDVWLLHHLLDLLRALPPATRYSQARKSLQETKLLRPHKPQRYASLLEALAFMGVLETPERPGLFTRFTTARERDQRPSVRVEVPAPLAWWSAGDGTNGALLQRLFGHLERPEGEPAAPPPPPRARPAAQPPGVARAPRALPGPLAAGDVYAVRFREDLWGAAYCHEVTPDARGILRGRMEYLDILSPIPPTADAVAGRGFRDRTHDGSRWQTWCAGLDKTTGVKRIAAQVPAPPHAQPTPDRLPVGSAKDLRHLAAWNFPQL
ncbi:hypothetical protein [Acidovorax sp. Root219]|uniref:hypothetical protein n=1 Tax=Acidovorax sp. Root219 TaxID=1736493 RepID=UPI000AC84A26|nr:hypothetical protein [Acidovorax sp. Root219]